MKPKQKVGWKMVRVYNNKYYSAVQNRISGRVQYEPGKRTFPFSGHGPLCVFRTREHARTFRRFCPYLRVKKCTYVPSKHTHVWYLYHGQYSKDSNYLPAGTVLADEVTILPTE